VNVFILRILVVRKTRENVSFGLLWNFRWESNFVWQLVIFYFLIMTFFVTIFVGSSCWIMLLCHLLCLLYTHTHTHTHTHTYQLVLDFRVVLLKYLILYFLGCYLLENLTILQPYRACNLSLEPSTTHKLSW